MKNHIKVWYFQFFRITYLIFPLKSHYSVVLEGIYFRFFINFQLLIKKSEPIILIIRLKKPIYLM